MNLIKSELDFDEFDNIIVNDISDEKLIEEDIFRILIEKFKFFYDNVGSNKLSDLFREQILTGSSDNYYNYYKKLCNCFIDFIKNPKYACLFFEILKSDNSMFDIFFDNLRNDYEMLNNDVFTYQSNYFLIKIFSNDCDSFLEQLMLIEEFSSNFMTDLIYKHAGLNGNVVVFRDLPVEKKHLIVYFNLYSRNLNEVIDNNFVGLLSKDAIKSIKLFFSNLFFQRNPDNYYFIFMEYIKVLIKNKDNVNFFDNFSSFIVNGLKKDYDMNNSLCTLDGVNFAMNFCSKYSDIFEEMMKKKVIYNQDVINKIRYMIAMPLQFDIGSYDEFINISYIDLQKMSYVSKSNGARPFKRSMDSDKKYVIFNYEREIIRISNVGEINSVYSPYSHNDSIKSMYYFDFNGLVDNENFDSIAYKANTILGDIVLSTENDCLFIYLSPVDLLNEENIGKLINLLENLKVRENDLNIYCGIADKENKGKYCYFNAGEEINLEQLFIFLNKCLIDNKKKLNIK